MRTAILACMMLMGLAGCREVVLRELDQKQASEVVAILSAHGIPAFVATGTAGGAARYSISVKGKHYYAANTIVHEQDLPSNRRAGIDELIAQRGFLPSTRSVEAMRLDRALAVELEDVIGNLAWIHSVRAVVRRYSLDEGTRSAVSVVIKRGSDLNGKGSIQEVERLVVGVVPGISPEGIVIVSHSSEAESAQKHVAGVEHRDGTVLATPLVPFLKMWRVPEAEYGGLAVALIAFVVGSLFLGVGCGYCLALWGQFKRSSTPLSQHEQPRIGRKEGVQNDLMEVP